MCVTHNANLSLAVAWAATSGGNSAVIAITRNSAVDIVLRDIDASSFLFRSNAIGIFLSGSVTACIG